MCSGSEAGSYLRLIDSCITQLTAQGPSGTCNQSKQEEEEVPSSEFAFQNRQRGTDLELSTVRRHESITTQRFSTKAVVTRAE